MYVLVRVWRSMWVLLCWKLWWNCISVVLCRLWRLVCIVWLLLWLICWLCCVWLCSWYLGVLWWCSLLYWMWCMCLFFLIFCVNICWMVMCCRLVCMVVWWRWFDNGSVDLLWLLDLGLCDFVVGWDYVVWVFCGKWYDYVE